MTGVTLRESALAAAQKLAETYYPITEAQRDAQTAIYQAVATGSLHQVKEALLAASPLMVKRRDPRAGLATPSWKRAAQQWVAITDRLIFGSADQERAA